MSSKVELVHGGVTGDVTGLELAEISQQSHVSVMGSLATSIGLWIFPVTFCFQDFQNSDVMPLLGEPTRFWDTCEKWWCLTSGTCALSIAQAHNLWILFDSNLLLKYFPVTFLIQSQHPFYFTLFFYYLDIQFSEYRSSLRSRSLLWLFYFHRSVTLWPSALFQEIEVRVRVCFYISYSI